MSQERIRLPLLIASLALLAGPLGAQFHYYAADDLPAQGRVTGALSAHLD